MRKHFLSPLVPSLFLLAAMPAAAQDAGRVLFVKGDVQLVAPDGSSRAAVKGMEIRPGERMVTGADGIGQAKLPEGTRVSLRPDSGLRFNRRPSTGPRPMELTGGNVRVLTEGLVRTDQGSIGQPAQPAPTFVLKTPGGEVSLSRADAVAAVQKQASTTLVRVNEGLASARVGTGPAVALGRDQVAALDTAGVQRLNAGAAGSKAALPSPVETTVSGRERPAPNARPVQPLSPSPALSLAAADPLGPSTGTAPRGSPISFSSGFSPRNPARQQPQIASTVREQNRDGAPLIERVDVPLAKAPVFLPTVLKLETTRRTGEQQISRTPTPTLTQQRFDLSQGSSLVSSSTTATISFDTKQQTTIQFDAPDAETITLDRSTTIQKLDGNQLLLDTRLRPLP